LFGFEIASAAPVLSRLSESSGCGESEVLFLERNIVRVAELKHVTERDEAELSTVRHWKDLTVCV
jgi:hypothetical protein